MGIVAILRDGWGNIVGGLSGVIGGFVSASPCGNGYIYSLNQELRDELLNLEIFDTLYEAKVLIDRWRWVYNHIRPHSSLGYRPPAQEAVLPLTQQPAQICVN